jgi:hypothetical protein
MYQHPSFYNQLNNRNSQHFDISSQYGNDIIYDSALNSFTNQYTSNHNTTYNGMTMPYAVAYIRGGPLAPRLKGIVIFRSVPGGTEVCVEVSGLPQYKPAQNDTPPVGPHGFHIHEFGNCTVGHFSDPFREAGGHWNPTNQPQGNRKSGINCS